MYFSTSFLYFVPERVLAIKVCICTCPMPIISIISLSHTTRVIFVSSKGQSQQVLSAAGEEKLASRILSFESARDLLNVVMQYCHEASLNADNIESQ